MESHNFILATLFVAFLITLSNAGTLKRSEEEEEVEGFAEVETSEETEAISEEEEPDVAKRSLFPDWGSNYHRICLLNGKTLAHGEESNIGHHNPCLVMRCWEGQLSPVRDGCHYEGTCQTINSEFEFKCSRLRCTKETVNQSTMRYKVDVVSHRCQDAYGTCRSFGEHGFPFYVGRKAMFDSDFKSAEEYLTFAFEKCHRDSPKNKRLILIYLIPVKMLLGHMPKTELLRKYDLRQFSEVSQAVSSGNLLQLNAAMQNHEAFFIRCGIYLILEKLKIITYRNLFKKVEDIDDDETQCILANLIFENKIKGYISHQHKKLVVSKQNPFPVLSTVL